MNLENTYYFSHLHPGSSGFFLAFLSVLQPLVVSWVAENIHWPSEVSRKVFCRSSVVYLCIPIYWSALAVGHIWLQMFPFLLKEEESSPSSWELLLIQRAAARKQHVVIILPDSSRMYSMWWPENKVIKLPYPSVITFWVRWDLRKNFFWAVKSMVSDFLKTYSPLCSLTHFSNPIFPERAPR